MIREATVEDTRPLTRMGLDYYDALRGKRFPPLEEVAHKIKAFMENTIASAAFRVAVVDVDGELVGMMISYIGGGAMVWDPEYVIASEVCMWVDPEHRHGGLGGKLIDDLYAWAAEHPLRPRMVHVMSYQHFDPRGMDKLFRSRGFALEQKTYSRTVK